jgi:propionyl-CoA synthetase
MGAYRRAYKTSLSDPEGFWLEQARLVSWDVEPTSALDAAGAPFYRWFPDARLNTCHNALDRHVEAGHGARIAVIYDSAVTGVQRQISYAELLEDVRSFAGALVGHGVERGDRVVIYMPMVSEAVVAMLACARIGAIHSVVFGGFAPRELAARIEDASAKAIVTASCGIEPSRTIEYKPLIDQAVELSTHKPEVCIVLQRPEVRAELDQPIDVDWAEAMRIGAERPADCVSVASTDPLYILYTSGTTGRPKGIVRDNGGHAVAMAWSLANIYGISPGDVWWAASDIGWVVGHSYIVYAPLIAGATTVLYEGKPVGTPDAGAFWRVISQYGVAALFTAPTAIRAIKKEDPEARLLDDHDVSSLRTLFLAGERLDPSTYDWASGRLCVPVVDNWWQTETGWPIAANPRGLEPMAIKRGSPSVAVPGYALEILDGDGKALGAGEEGAICIRLPLPPGAMSTVWRDDQRFVSSYLSAYDGYYLTGDGGYLDEDGYLYVLGRTDDVMNVAGHRLSTGSMEAVITQHPAVAECAVIGVHDELKGQLPHSFVVLKAGVTRPPGDIESEIVSMVREQIGAVAAFRKVTIVDALPKTRSGKILRKPMREIADGKEPQVPATIEDIAVLERVRATLRNS